MKKRAPKSKVKPRKPEVRPPLGEPEVHDRLASTGFPPPEAPPNEPFERPSAPALGGGDDVGSIPHSPSAGREAADG